MTKRDPTEPSSRATSAAEGYLRLHRRPLRERLALAGPDAVEWFDRTNETIEFLTQQLLAMSRAADRTRDLLLEFERKHL